MISGKKVKELIQNGFDLELISFEFDKPIEYVEKCRLELEKEIKREDEKENYKAHLKMQKIRERYEKLYFGNNKIEVKQDQEILKENEEEINSIISEFEEILESIKDKELEKKDKIKKVETILRKLKQIEEYSLSINQAEKLYSLLQLDEVQKLNGKREDRILIDRNKKIAVRKLAKAIDIAQIQTNELEELKKLYKKLTIEMQQQYPIEVAPVKVKIRGRIERKNQEEAMNRIIDDVPENIKNIISDIAKGTLDIQRTNKIIEKEVQRRIENTQQNRFSLTKEQVKRQIFMQIITGLEYRAEQYYIQSPEKTIMQIQLLCGVELQQAIKAVIKNLTNVKDFERAKQICNKFLEKDNDNELSKYMNNLIKQIRNDEISNFIMKGIKTQGNWRDERKYLYLIEKGLKKKNVNLHAISLGKSQDGLKSITLADICSIDKRKNEKTL